MKELKGTKTLENLMAAFAGESMATNKYAYFASKAKKDGFNQIAAIFEETSGNEREHAKMWYKLIAGGIGTTAENLAAAAIRQSGARGGVRRHCRHVRGGRGRREGA